MSKKIFGVAVLLTGVLIFAGAGCASKNLDGQNADKGRVDVNKASDEAVNPISPVVPSGVISDENQTPAKNTMLEQCAQAPSQDAKDNCYANVALQSRDVSFCQQISDSVKANQCSMYINALNSSPKK